MRNGKWTSGEHRTQDRENSLPQSGPSVSYIKSASAHEDLWSETTYYSPLASVLPSFAMLQDTRPSSAAEPVKPQGLLSGYPVCCHGSGLPSERAIPRQECLLV